MVSAEGEMNMCRVGQLSLLSEESRFALSRAVDIEGNAMLQTACNKWTVLVVACLGLGTNPSWL